MGKSLPDQAAGALSAESLWKTFLAGLALPDEVFWVNLNPSEPNRIIDARLAETDIGRVMLEADLQLKYDAAEIIDPRRSETGQEYWRRLQQIGGQPSLSRSRVDAETRAWIVPGPARIECSGAQAYVAEAQLDVMLESERLAASGVGRAKRDSTRVEVQALAKELVLPELRRRVNSDPQYALLRQAYHSLVLARWCKTQLPAALMPFATEVNTGTVPDGAISVGWDPKRVFHAYLRSVRQGIFDFTERRGNVVSRYICGGVDWTQSLALEQRQPMTSEVRRVLNAASARPSGSQVDGARYFGGRIVLAPG